jgi:hypothetical protein
VSTIIPMATANSVADVRTRMKANRRSNVLVLLTPPAKSTFSPDSFSAY